MKTIYIQNTLFLLESDTKYTEIVEYLNDVLVSRKGLMKEFETTAKQKISYIVIEDEESE
jgi:predicted NUDIX family phosphoesterase